MSKGIVIVFLMTGVISVTFSQSTSRDNYTGDWENAASWAVGGVPPADIALTHLDLTIDGYITRTGNINVAFNTETKDFIVNDTLVILGDFNFDQNSAELVIGPNAVLIVIGNFSAGNNHRITNNGIFVVYGDMTFPANGSETYDGSGGGELFVFGDAENNPDASAADKWDQLDDLYPVIYEFTICMSGGGANCSLPIKLSYFLAELLDGVVQLKWATTMEENFQKFTVQRSSDGLEFENLADVSGKGFNIYDIESKYSFRDNHPLIGYNYYRLKAIDLDDSFAYFGVKAVRLSAQKTMAVFPNPASGSSICFNTNFHPGESDRVILLDQRGIEIFNTLASKVHEGISFQDKLRAGVYFLRYRSNDFEETTRVLIKN